MASVVRVRLAAGCVVGCLTADRLIGRLTAGGGDGGGDPGRAEQVDLDGLVERGVEADGRRGVDDDVAGGEEPPAVVVEAETVAADVTGDGDEPAGRLVGEAVAELVAEAVEAVVLQDLAGRPLRRAGPATRTDEHDDLGVRDRPEQPFDQRGAEETGRSGDEEPLPGQLVGDSHLRFLPLGKSGVYHLVGNGRLPCGRWRPGRRGAGAARPTGSSTPRSRRSGRVATKRRRWTRSPGRSTSRSRRSSTGSRARTHCSSP